MEENILNENQQFNNMEICFDYFDKNRDNNISLDEFMILCERLFLDADGHRHNIRGNQIRQIFDVFDTNSDDNIDREEFKFCWNSWIEVILRPKSAFLIVDVQNDFISGSLNISNCPAKQNGIEVIEPINTLLHTVIFDTVFYTLDWHPSNHISFFDNLKTRLLHETSSVDANSANLFDTVIFAGPPPVKQRLWPRHCVQNSWGAELHEKLKIADNSLKIYKGTNSEIDSYSAFWDNNKISETVLNTHLKSKGITDIYICGLAYDVCVLATAIDALRAGYRTILVDDCCRGVDLYEIDQAKHKINSNYGIIVESVEVKAMVEGRDRRSDLGYNLAMQLKNFNITQET